MSNPITITDLTLGNPNSTEDPKIANNFSALKTWLTNPGLQAADLASNSVTTAKIADSTGASDGVTTAKIATGAVTAAKLATDAVTTAKIDTGAVTTDEVASNAISAAKIRVFTVPVVVTQIPGQVTSSATCDFSSASTTVSDLNIVSGQSAPQVGQVVTGSGIASDTVITAVSGSGTGPFTLTLSRATTASGANVALTYAPQDGDEVYWSVGSGRYWHMRYVNAESVYKWVFVGGSPLVVSGGNLTTFNSTTYADSTSVVDLDLPSNNYTGEFEVELSCLMKVAVNLNMFLSYKIGTNLGGWTTPSDANAIYAQNPVTSSNQSLHVDLSKRSIVTTSGSNGFRFRLQHKTSAATNCTWDNREIRIRPIRAI